jgi:chitosanase
MNLTTQQKRICEQIVNIFETGKAEGDYSAIAIFHDGPHGIRQVTYGRSQTTEYGNLEDLVKMYADVKGVFSDQLRPFVDKIGVVPLVEDEQFKQLLRDAGRNDSLMRQVQDTFFDKHYFAPAMDWMEKNGFTLPLSTLVIYDSFVHSGTVPAFLRKRFSEVVPVQGGDEKTWIVQYVGAREAWLSSADNPALHSTVYRTQCFAREIGRRNWDLSQLPINAHGVSVIG